VEVLGAVRGDAVTPAVFTASMVASLSAQNSLPSTETLMNPIAIPSARAIQYRLSARWTFAP
jgi:hypothetical protein